MEAERKLILLRGNLDMEAIRILSWSWKANSEWFNPI